MKTYYVYIIASRRRVLYVGMTNNLERRLAEHRSPEFDGFTHRYRVNRLVHFETTNDVRVALEREKEIKGWRREKKIALVASMNPGFNDLTLEW